MAKSSPRVLAYARWHQMIQRCTNPNHRAWKWYGARGITVCEEWFDFETYRRDVGEPPFPGASLDRTDNDGNYEIDNVRWTTQYVQVHNRRSQLKDVCPSGHEFTSENTYQPPGGATRQCRECRRWRHANPTPEQRARKNELTRLRRRASRQGRVAA